MNLSYNALMPKLKVYTSKGKVYTYLRPNSAQRRCGLKPRRLLSDKPEEEAKRAIFSFEERLNDGELDSFRRHLAVMLKKAEARARTKGIAFDLERRDVIGLLEEQQFACAVTKIPFQFASNLAGYRQPFRPSIDRIDARGGYTKDNIRIVCVAVNVALADWGDEVFWRVVRAAAGTLTEQKV